MTNESMNLVTWGALAVGLITFAVWWRRCDRLERQDAAERQAFLDDQLALLRDRRRRVESAGRHPTSHHPRKPAS